MKYVAVLAALGLGSAVLLVNPDAFAQGRQGGFMERLKAADRNADGMLDRQEAIRSRTPTGAVARAPW